MEWVETTGKTVEEAKDKALDQLGVALEDAEFDVLEEPKPGLFGRLRGEARVRARVRPTQARQKVDRRDRKRQKDSDGAAKPESADAPARAKKSQPAAKPAGEAASAEPRGERSSSKRSSRSRSKSSSAAADSTPAAPASEPAAEATTAPAPTPKQPKEQHVDAHQVGEEARTFINGLLEAFGLEGQVELVEQGDDLELRVHGSELGLLVGPRGNTLQAVQDLTRVASQRRLGDHDTRLRVDIGGYRERRSAALAKFATQMADEVKSSGVARVLEPMSSADRRVIHDTLAGVEGVTTRSEGDDPHRRVVIAPAND